jgi:multiple sugar transport system substrate-binding protein/sn-glycerol 3-phosphate transport system substrate-binding protein
MGDKPFILRCISMLILILLAGCNLMLGGSDIVETPVETATTETLIGPEKPENGSSLTFVDPEGQTIQLWHTWGTGSITEALQDLVEEFNATNEHSITVEISDYANYQHIRDSLSTAVQSGTLPQIVVGYSYWLDAWYSEGILTTLNPFINNVEFGLISQDQASYYAPAWNSGLNHRNVRVGFPHGQHTQLLYYNNTWARDLGFQDPPGTLAEFRTQACAATIDPNGERNDLAGGFAIDPTASNVAGWVYALESDLFDDSGESYDFTSTELFQVAEYWKMLLDEGCAYILDTSPEVAFSSREALFVMNSTENIPAQLAAYDSQSTFRSDEWQIIAVPGEQTASVNHIVQNFGIIKSTPEMELASWLFIKWFTSLDNQAKWVASTGYLPVREDIDQFLDEYMVDNPIWSQALEFGQLGYAEPGWASWKVVQRDVEVAFSTILRGDLEDIEPALTDLEQAAQEAVFGRD